MRATWGHHVSDCQFLKVVDAIDVAIYATRWCDEQGSLVQEDATIPDVEVELKL